MADNVLDMDLSPEDENLLRETLDSWKEEVTEKLIVEAEEAKETMIEQLEEKNIEFRESLKEEFATKMLEALKEMREEIRAEVISEVYDNNPELKILEQVKELVAPTLNEDYLGNMYAEEIQTLREKVVELEDHINLDEGAKKLAELIAPYNSKTQKLILALIKEGGPDEVAEQFYEIIESLNDDDDEDYYDDEDWDEEEFDEDDEDDDDEDEDDEDEDDEDDEEEDDEDEDDEDEEETDEDWDEDFETYIKEGEEGEEEVDEKPKSNSLKDTILKMVE